MGRKQLRELLAELEHEQWQAWTTHIVGEWEEELPAALIKKWKANWKPYNDLSEKTKDSDRIWADKIISILPKTKSKIEIAKEEPSNVKPAFESFVSICQSIKGFKPEINYGIEGKMIKEKLKTYSLDQLKELFTWYLKSEDSKKFGCTIKIALSNYNFNKWLQSKAKPKFNI
jgi:hypothetical protein